jgi:hypothetical protein
LEAKEIFREDMASKTRSSGESKIISGGEKDPGTNTNRKERKKR